MSDTPRTDKREACNGNVLCGAANLDLAREIERELNESLAREAQLREALLERPKRRYREEINMADTTDTLRSVDLPRSCSASTLIILLRLYAKEEREKSINSTRREPKIMHAYAANRLEAVLLAVGASKHEPND
jgi:hypothetical protein